jgi:hypothetical protein
MQGMQGSEDLATRNHASVRKDQSDRQDQGFFNANTLLNNSKFINYLVFITINTSPIIFTS